MNFSLFLSYLEWDPNRVLFVIPGLNHPLSWYGLLFTVGFLVGYFFMRSAFRLHLLAQKMRKEEAGKLSMVLVDRLSFLAVLGTLVGARLGHIFFYGWPYFRAHPLEMLKIWEGGLASHGAAIGLLGALLIFRLWNRRIAPSVTFLVTLDAFVIATAFAGGCIRLGNFINQEILGTPTHLPWGVIFLHPLGGPVGVPLHPVQLYEAVAYFAIALFLYFLWKSKRAVLGRGGLSGWFFTLVFGFRFFAEFFKLPQSEVIHEELFRMGQWLSLPFILGGLLLLGFSIRREKRS